MTKSFKCARCNKFHTIDNSRISEGPSSCGSNCERCLKHCAACKIYCEKCYTLCECGRYSHKNSTCECKQNTGSKDLVVDGHLIVNEIADRLPSETTIYSSNIVHNQVKKGNNYMILDTIVQPDGSLSNKDNYLLNNKHSVFLGRNVSKTTPKGQILAEFAGISSNSNNINASLKFITKEKFQRENQNQSTKANIEINNQTVASFQQVNNVANMGTGSITLSIYYNNPPEGLFKEGTIALLKRDNMYCLIVFNGSDWEKL